MFVSQEAYLTKELIANLEFEASQPHWRMGYRMAVMGSQNWYNLLSVSPNGLIHFNGNSDTGWKHISMRHQVNSGVNYFGSGALGEPSKFTSKSIPFEDYIRIADDVFLTGEIDTKEHRHSALFTKYVGKTSRYIGSNGEQKEFSLIVYKKTKIVHSIFPKKNLEGKGKKRILANFAKAKNLIKHSFHLTSGQMTIIVPYVNEKGIVRYVVVIEFNTITTEGITHLEVYSPDGKPAFKTDKAYPFNWRDIDLIKLIANQQEMAGFLYAVAELDLSHIELNILEIESKEFPD